MTRHLSTLLVAILLAMTARPTAAQQPDDTVLPTFPSAPPVAETDPVELTIHGHVRVDPYFWLREREDP